MLEKGQENENLGTTLLREETIDKEALLRDLKNERDDAFLLVKEYKDHHDILLEGLSLLSRLILLPTHDAPTTRTDRNFLHTQPYSPSPIHEEVHSIHQKLDVLRESKCLDNTPFPHLLTAIQRLKSNLKHSIDETELTEEEIMELKVQSKKSSEQIETMKKALKKLYKSHIKRKKQLSSVEHKYKSLMEKLDEIADTTRINEVNQHEMILQGISEMSGTDGANDANKQGQPRQEDCEDAHSTASSTITSTGISTLSLRREECSCSISRDSWSTSWDSSPECNVQRKVFSQPPSAGQKVRKKYDLFFSNNTKMGLHFYQMPVDQNGTILHKGRLSNQILQSDHPPCEDSGNVNNTTFSYSNTEIKRRNPTKQAFLVSGYDDFDTKLNTRPSIGARLISVNGESLEYGEWTISNVIDKLVSKRPITLTFQDYALTTKQLDVLRKASRNLEESKKRKNSLTTPNSPLQSQSQSHSHSHSHSPRIPFPSPQHQEAPKTLKMDMTPILRDFSPTLETKINLVEDNEPQSVDPKSKPQSIHRSPRSIMGKLQFRWN